MTMHTGLLPDNHMFILAESLFELGRTDEALVYFSLLEEVPDYTDLARYRIGQMEHNETITNGYIKRLQRIAGSSIDLQWHRFASQKLRYMQLMEML